tara:strand:+ start:21415 stop:21711 length:297 start_codon:yes stop_codon:yes gene_type:complete
MATSTRASGAAAAFLSQRPTAIAIAKKVGHQFPNTPEGKLMRSIFHLSVVDLFVNSQRRSACRHLQGRIFEAEICGIDSDWIRHLFRTAGVSIEERAR